MSKRFLILLFLCFAWPSFFAQQDKIKIRRQHNQLYFYQKGSPNDTIEKNKNDLFYLIVPDTLSNLVISVENGNFQKTKNDSLVKLIYIPGIKYECVFIEKQNDATPEHDKKIRERNCLINGMPEQNSNTIKITFTIKGQSKPILENKFVFH